MLPKGELAEIGKWKDKSIKAKGGTVFHPFVNDGSIKKACGHAMGEKCDCKKD